MAARGGRRLARAREDPQRRGVGLSSGPAPGGEERRALQPAAPLVGGQPLGGPRLRPREGPRPRAPRVVQSGRRHPGRHRHQVAAA
eukprot:11227220-Lingulodinium_polyedra.AAC.1